MNWGLVGWIIGALLTIYAIKFVFLLMKSIFSKETMRNGMEVLGDSVSSATKKFERFLKKKAKERKVKKYNKEAEKTKLPTITIG